MEPLHPTIEQELRELHVRLSADGTIPPAPKLLSYYDTFRRNFGPDALLALEGQDLLERMHAHGGQDSMVYWLEFKDDDEFPAIFGSIAGGSALKFGVYRRAETGTWAARGSGPVPRDITVAEAIRIATRHREQLLAAVDVVASTPPSTEDESYLKLQRELTKVAPDVEDTAWGHKYLSLIFPERIDDFHVVAFQQHHLVRLLQLPPRVGEGWAPGRYVSGGRYKALAEYLGVALHEVTMLLNRRNGPPRAYWRIGTTDNERERRKYWPLMRDSEVAAVGWQEIGDLSEMGSSGESKAELIARVAEGYPGRPKHVNSRSGGELFDFARKISQGDRIIAADGQTVLGIGEIAGSYSYDRAAGFPHQRPVKWLSVEEWGPLTEGLRTSVFRLRKLETLVEIEKHVLGAPSTHGRPAPAPKPKPPRRGPLRRLDGVPGQLQQVLERKGQAILYGPPGTGKTFWGLRTARELASLRAFGRPVAELTDVERRAVFGDAPAPLVRMTSFHPEYGYEDFIEGYRPSVDPNGSLTFHLVPGTFRRLCADAAAQPDRDFYLVIDEINRGDVPRIFGELLTLLEKDKRGEIVPLSSSGESFHVPQNVFVIGTMNTADRSIALLDVALRRRFGFVELMPDYEILSKTTVGGLPIAPWLRYLNDRIRSSGGGDARNRQIGHAFLLTGGSPVTTVEQLGAVLRDDILPLLEEYCYDDFEQIAGIVGEKLVDLSRHRIRHELLDPANGDQLITALSRPEFATATESVMRDAGAEEGATPDADDESPALPAPEDNQH